MSPNLPRSEGGVSEVEEGGREEIGEGGEGIDWPLPKGMLLVQVYFRGT